MAFWNIFKKKTQVDLTEDDEKLLNAELRKIKAYAAKEEADAKVQTIKILEEEKQLDAKIRMKEKRAELEPVCEHGVPDNQFCAVCDVDEEEDQNTPDKLLATLFMGILAKGQINPQTQPQQQAQPQQAAPTMGVSYSDEQLKETWNLVPDNYKNIARQMSDDNLRGYIISKQPDMDADSISRAIKLVRAK
jgi:hypothetical protein